MTNLFSLVDESRGEKSRLSKATGISSGNISDWKSGRSKPSAEALALIADYYQTSIDYLLGRSEIREITPVLEISENGREMLGFFEELPSDLQRELIGEARAYYRMHEKEKAPSSESAAG